MPKSEEAVAIERGFKTMAEQLNAITRTLQQCGVASANNKDAIAVLNVASHGMNIPVELDWIVPAIKSEAEFEWQEDGRLEIKISIVGEDASIVEDGLTNSEGTFETLQLSMF